MKVIESQKSRLSRRSFLQATTVSIVPPSIVPNPTNERYRFVYPANGAIWSVSDPAKWCVDNANNPLLCRASQRLAKIDLAIESERAIDVTLRRCGLLLIENLSAKSIKIHYWSNLHDEFLQQYFQAEALARSGVLVLLFKRKYKSTSSVDGTKFLFGRPISDFPWEEYTSKWRYRHVIYSNDTELALYAGSFMNRRLTPFSWIKLKEIWCREEDSYLCPNCETETIFHFIAISDSSGVATRLCLGCRRSHLQTLGQRKVRQILSDRNGSVS